MKNPVSTFIYFSIVAIYFCHSLSAQQETETPPQSKSGTAATKLPPEPHPIFASVTDVEGLPRVLLIGDSISMGYTLGVRELLKDKANVHRPPTNCGPTTNGLKSLDQWLSTGGADKKWDVIHFNWGLHDLKYIGEDGKTLVDVKQEGSHRQVSPEEYRKNLQALVKRLKQTRATLIWRNTTPVPEGAKGRVVGDSAEYNKIAAEIMEAEKIQTHDLYTFALEHQKEIQRKADVHYTDEGSRKLAEEVARVIAEALKHEN